MKREKISRYDLPGDAPGSGVYDIERLAAIPEVKRIERNPAKPFDMFFWNNVSNESNAESTAAIYVDIG